MPTTKYWRPGGHAPSDLTQPTIVKKKKFLRPTKKIAVYDDHGNTLPDLHDDGGGIKIVVDIPEYVGMTNLEGDALDVPSDFAAYTVMCLRLLYALPTGKTILDTLMQRDVSIESHPVQNSARGAPNMHGVAAELGKSLVVGRCPVTSQAIGRMLVPGGAERYAYLARRINGMQRLHLDAPDNAPPMNMNITRNELHGWIENGTAINRLTADQLVQLKLATIAALDVVSPRATPSGSGVAFCTKRGTMMNTTRPPAIGLGHELVHCYFYARGEQPGRDFGDFTTALFEFKCVGMGPWAQANVTENKLRQEWAAVIGNYGQDVDDLNNKSVGRRMRYM